MTDTFRSSQSLPPPETEWLVNQIAHTLRNPIFAAMVQSEALLVRVGQAEGIASSIQLVHRQLKRLESNINEMLLYGRPAKLVPRRVDLVRLVQQVVEAFGRGEVEAPANVELATAWASLELELDPDAIKIILERLLRNAVQHTRPPHQVFVGLSGSDQTLHLTVQDHGEGIPESIRDKMFHPFYPQHSGRPGLGLAVAAKFASALDGHLEVESEESRGTLVRCVLPLRRPRPRE